MVSGGHSGPGVSASMESFTPTAPRRRRDEHGARAQVARQHVARVQVLQQRREAAAGLQRQGQRRRWPRPAGAAAAGADTYSVIATRARPATARSSRSSTGTSDSCGAAMRNALHLIVDARARRLVAELHRHPRRDHRAAADVVRAVDLRGGPHPDAVHEAVAPGHHAPAQQVGPAVFKGRAVEGTTRRLAGITRAADRAGLHTSRLPRPPVIRASAHTRREFMGAEKISLTPCLELLEGQSSDAPVAQLDRASDYGSGG